MSEKQLKKTQKKIDKGKEVEMPHYDLNNLIMRDYGGVVLVGEEFYYYTTISTTVSNGKSSTTTDYHYDYQDIAVVNISPEGEIEWLKQIPKYQASTNDDGYRFSYGLCVYEDKLFFVFNDNIKNLNHKKGDKIYNYVNKNFMLALVVIDGNGQITKKSLIKGDDTNLVLLPHLSVQISKNELVLFAKRKKNIN